MSKFILNINHDLNRRLKRVRARKGLYVASYNSKVDEHPLVGKKVRKYNRNEIGVIESIHKQWYAGWFYMALIRYGKSHSQAYVENINSTDEIVIEAVKEFKQDWYVLGEKKEIV